MPRQHRLNNKPKKRKSPTVQTEGWYIIKRILQERKVRGRVEYLVDWEDDPVSGESYSATWAKDIDVTEAAKREWETRNAAQQQGNLISASTRDSTEAAEFSDATRSPHSAQPLNRAGQSSRRHRKLPSLGDDGEASEEPPRKRTRLDYDPSSSAEPVPSITSGSSFETFEEQLWAERPVTNISVEIPKALDVDATEYHRVHTSQSTTNSSGPLSELESQDQRIAVPSNPSQGTIPDSQEPSYLSTLQSQGGEHPYCLPSQTLPASEPQDEQVTEACTNSLPQTVPDSFPDRGGASASEDQAPVDSSEADCDIPSHQISNTANSRGLTGDRSAENIQTETDSRSSDQSAQAQLTQENNSFEVPPISVLEESQGRSSEPVFLTQPDFSHVLGSSLSTTNTGKSNSSQSVSAVLASDHRQRSRSAVVESSSSCRLSEAAQAIAQGLDSSEKQFLSEPSSPESRFQTVRNPIRSETNAVESLELSGAKSLGEKGSDKETTSPQSTPHLSAEEFVRRVFETPDREVDAILCMMFNTNSPNPTPSGRRSAVDELRSLWDDDTPADPKQTSTDLAENPGNAQQASTTEGRDAPPVTNSWADSAPPTTNTLANDTVMPSPIMQPPRRSAVETMQALVNEAFGDSSEPVHASLIVPEPQALLQATVSPADVSKPTEMESATLALLPSMNESSASLGTVQSSGNVITMGQVPMTRENSSPPTDDDIAPRKYKHIITLPFQASIRALYDETLLKYRREVTRFGEAFTNEIYVEPDVPLVKSVDQLLRHLQNLCDYPQDILETALKDMSTSKRVKYSLDANSKLNFVYEILQGLEKATNLLIIAQSTNNLSLIGEVAEVLGVDYACASTQHRPETGSFDSIIRATLALPDEAIPDLSEFDVVILYDPSLLGCLDQRQVTKKGSPQVLTLVTAYSLEHIDLHITGTDDSLERKNVLLSGIVNARPLVSDPPTLQEPHEVAKIFYDYLNGDSEILSWEPDPIPEQILDVYFNSQAMSQLPPATPQDGDNGRKRKLDEDEDDGESKKMRTEPRSNTIPKIDEPPLPDEVQSMLDKCIAEHSARPSSEIRVSVPLSALEALAEKISESGRLIESADRQAQYESVIALLEKQIKDHERTASKLYGSNRIAIQDRTEFEAKARKAEATLLKEVEKARESDEKKDAKIAELQATIARLTVEAGTQTAAGEPEKLLQAAKERIQGLEKRLNTSHSNEEYTRKLYQDASSGAASMRAEINELKAQNAKLQQQASANLTRIHEIQANSATTAYLRQIAELKAQMGEREVEVDRMRDELRQLKNGRRETRQVSVPRSPRLGLMSPRPPRAVAGPVSRGASPGPIVPGFDIAAGPAGAGQQSGNGRWSYLRD